MDRQGGQVVQGRLLGQNQAAGVAKDIREGLDTAVGTGFEEQVGGEVTLLAGQVLDQMEATAGVEAQGQGVHLRRPADIGVVGAGAFGNVVGVFLIAFVILGEALLEPVDPAGVE